MGRKAVEILRQTVDSAMNKKVCVITSTRADYGLLRWVMQGIKEDADLYHKLSLLVCIYHLNLALPIEL